MTDEPESTDTPDEPSGGASEPESAETPDAGDAPAAEPEADAEPEGASTELAVPDEATVAVPAAVTGPAVDPRAEAKRTRVVLPFLIPIGAVLTVAFFALNISRVFLAASEGGQTFAVVVAVTITLSILVGATVVAALPELRTSSLVLGMSGVAIVVMLAGSLVLGASLPKSAAKVGYVQPSGRAINTLEIEAMPTLSFQAKSFNVPAGINLIKYIDKGGTHTLVFDGTEVPGFELNVPTGQNAAKVDLKQGKTYTVFCTIPGHRQAGMQASIIVGPPAGKPIPGTQSPTVTTVKPGTSSTSNPGTGPGTNNGASQSSTGGK
jgi:plastocyanin